MKLVRLGDPGKEKPFVLVADDAVVSVADVVEDFDGAFFAAKGPAAISSEVTRRLRAGRVERIGDRRIGPPIARPHQILCIGLNYLDHAIETGNSVPTEPIVFSKAPNTLVGPYDNVHIPPGSASTDWEVELGVVIGRPTYQVDRAGAAAAIAGWTAVNDLSERDFQLNRGGQWVKGKSCPTFNPCGPWLATADTLPDASSLRMRLWVNGDIRQDGTTASMIFDPIHLVTYLSAFMSLEPGDLICTGTPAGVGMARVPPEFLRAGDVVELEVDGLGRQRQECVASTAVPIS